MSNTDELLPHDKATYTMHEAAEVVGVSRQTLYTQVNRGRLRLTKIGRKTLVLRPDLEAFLKGEAMRPDAGPGRPSRSRQ
jgi:excisionase family DNA binding protein